MSSLKMTFSLASLVILIAFAFVVMPVTAHEGDAAVPLREHGHPTKGLPALDGPDEGTEATNAGEGEVPPHGVHPDPAISLKAGDNVRGDKIMIVPAATDATDTLSPISFTIVVDFGIDVNGGDHMGDQTAVDKTDAGDIDRR